MINEDTIVKYSVEQLKRNFMPKPECNNWVDYSRFLIHQIKYIKDGFPGISDSDLQLIDLDKVIPGIRIILDDNLDANCGVTNTDHAAILGLVKEKTGDNKILIEIEGIGQGFDFTRDPDRNLKWKKEFVVDLNKYHCILQMITTPREDGSPVYYYYYKSTRDSRY